MQPYHEIHLYSLKMQTWRDADNRSCCNLPYSQIFQSDAASALSVIK